MLLSYSWLQIFVGSASKVCVRVYECTHVITQHCELYCLAHLPVPNTDANYYMIAIFIY